MMNRFARFALTNDAKQVFQGVSGVPSTGEPQKPAISLVPGNGTPATTQGVQGVPQKMAENRHSPGIGTPGTPGTPACDPAAGVDWNADDWRAFYDERAAIAEYDGGLPRPEAEARAWECSVAHWCNLIPPPATTGDGCPVCGNPLGDAAVPVLRPGGGHVWLHHGCIQPFNVHRLEQARRALAEAGIAIPPTATNERT
ncbi:MAG TPA: hypothetical protein VK196_01010 [Magnetospirillum sp.]|nr:hypothetical protein [Magnetospirillum sp.]